MSSFSAQKAFVTGLAFQMILKAKTGKLTLPVDIDLLLFELQDEFGIRLLTVKPKHLKQLYALETFANHKDPFDHLLICQAIAEKLIMISADRNFPHYRIQGLQLVENVVYAIGMTVRYRRGNCECVH